MSRIGRRTFISAGLAGGVALGVGIPFSLGGWTPTSTGSPLPSLRPLPEPFARALTVPPVLQPVRVGETAEHYDITQTLGTASIFTGVSTPIWGYNGIFPGPTIVSRRGRAAIVTHTNTLPVPTVVHLHGGRTPPDSDGYPIDFIMPTDSTYMDSHMNIDHSHGAMTAGDTTRGSRIYTYPMDQRAATLWYHDHRMDFTGPSVWRGLAGFHIIRDDEEDALGLPSGGRELLLMLTDRSFDAEGAFRYPSVDGSLLGPPGVTERYVAGVLGDVMLVNGTPWPVARVDAGPYRLRILNACNARRLSLRLDPSPGGALTQIGTDGGLLAAPIRHDSFELAPAQRTDLIVDFSEFSAGTAVTLYDDFGVGEMSRIMRFVVGERSDVRFTLPDRLSGIEPIDASRAVTTRRFRFQSGDVNHSKGWLIDGRPFSPDDISATVQLGTTEIWQLVSDFHHPVHLHLSPFQVLHRGIGGPGPFDAGWKDTIDLRPSEQAAIAIRFDGYAGKYVFHCHNLEHEDMAMMANFLTT